MPVRLPAHLEGLAGIVLPGGESTTMSMLLESSGLFDPLAELLDEGLPVLGTCAGMILLANDVRGGRDDQRGFARIDIAVRRNGYGRQDQSFECDLEVDALDQSTSVMKSDAMRAVFIRAPRVERVGPGVEVLARLASPVLCRQGPVMVACFHPELTADRRIHRAFCQSIARRDR